MAKLNVVIPAVSVVIGDVTYEKVSRAAKTGDVIRFTEEDGPDYMTEGGFYKVERVDGAGDPHVTDEDGDDYDLCNKDFEVYAPVTVAQPQYREVVRKAREGDKIRVRSTHRHDEEFEVGDVLTVKSVDSVGDILYVEEVNTHGCIFFSGQYGREYAVLEEVAEAAPKYREFDRDAQKGERIRIVDRDSTEGDYENGAEFIVNRAHSDGDVRVTCGSDDDKFVLRSEYVVLEPSPVASPERLTVGNYVKVIAEGGGHNYTVGTVVKIVKDDGDGRPYVAERVDGTRGNYLAPREVELATERDFLAQRRFEVGDYVKVVGPNDNSNNYEVGSVAKIATDEGGMFNNVHGYTADRPNGTRGNVLRSYQIVPATAEEIAEAQRKEFVAGDKVRLISGGGREALIDYEDGGVYTVTHTATGGHNPIRLTGGGQPSGYAAPGQLVKLTKEETAEFEKWAAIGRKVGEFRAGDIVEVTRAVGGHPIGTIGIAEYGSTFAFPCWGVRAGGKLCSHGGGMKLVAPVEQRFNTVA